MPEVLNAEVLRATLDDLAETLAALKKSVRLVHDQLLETRRNIADLKKQERAWQKTDNFKQWTDEDQIAAVKRFYIEFQRGPITSDFDNVEWLPSTTSVRGHWGSLAALREAAGLDAGFKGRGGSGRGGGWTAERKRSPFQKKE